MIQDYTVENEKIIAYDDKKRFLYYEYQDNINEILIQENIIEKINNDIQLSKSRKNKNLNEYYIKFEKFKYLKLIAYLAVALIILFIEPVLLILGIPIFLLADIITYLADIEPKNKLRNLINADTLVIEQLEELLEKENKKLEELKNTISKEEQINTNIKFKEKNNSKLEELNHLKELYHLCGYYAKKLIKYQEKQILKDKLDENFTNEDLVIIENLVKEKVPQLIKKK